MQDKIVELYQSSKSKIWEHIIYVLADSEFDQISVVRYYRATVTDDKSYNKNYFNLKMFLLLYIVLEVMLE